MPEPTPAALTAAREQQIRHRSREIHEQYHGASDVAYESCSACETDRLLFAALDSARAAHDALAADRDRLAAGLTRYVSHTSACHTRRLAAHALDQRDPHCTCGLDALLAPPQAAAGPADGGRG